MIENIFNLLKCVDNAGYFDEFMVATKDNECLHRSLRGNLFEDILADKCEKCDLTAYFIDKVFSWGNVSIKYGYNFERLNRIVSGHLSD